MVNHLNSSHLLKEFGGSASHDLNNLINHVDVTEEIDISSISQYVTIQQLPDYISVASAKNPLLTLNCQSINVKLDELYAVFHALHTDLTITLIQETWVSGIDQNQLPGSRST